MQPAMPVQPGANESDIILSKATINGFFTGALYAAVSGGPISVTAAAIAAYRLFTTATNEIVDNLVQRQLLTSKQAFAIKVSTEVLASSSLLIAGIAAGIIGPVAAVVIALCTAQAIVREVKKLQLPVTQPPGYPSEVSLQ